VAGASFPAYTVNPGTGADPTTTPLALASSITLGVRHGAPYTSSIIVPSADPS